MTDFFRSNGAQYSWASVTQQINGIPFKGIVGADWSEMLERKIVYGANKSGTPLGMTAGKYSVDSFTLKMLAQTYDEFTSTLLLNPLAIGSIGASEFVYSLQLIEPTRFDPILTVISGCKVKTVKRSHAEGIDELIREVEIQALSVVENGKTLWTPARNIGG